MTPFEYLCTNAKYIDHGDKKGDFWPHDCTDCVYSIQTAPPVDDGAEPYPVRPEEWGCELGCMRFRDLPLADYVAIRMKEENVNQSPCQCAIDCQECFTGECGE